MMRIRTRWLTALLVALVALTGCGGGSSGAGPTPTAVQTPVGLIEPEYVVGRGDVSRLVDFTGRISPVVEEELFFRTAGYVESVYVDRDDPVEEGELLAELEVTDLKNQLAQAEASLQSARDSSEQRIAEAQASQTVAELQLSIIRASDPEVEVIVAEVNLERAQLALADAQEDNQEAIDRIWEPDSVREAAARRLHDAEMNLRIVEAQYQQALNSRLIYYYNVQIQEQQVELARLQLEQLETGLAIQEIELLVTRLQSQLNDARLVAPFDGQVSMVGVSPGRAVEAYRSVLSVAQLDELEVSATLTPQQLQEVAEEMEVSCTLFNQPGDEVTGSIRRLPYPYGTGGRSTEAEDLDQSVRVTLDTLGSGLDLSPGTLMRCVAIVESAEDVLILPREAVRVFEGRRFVVVKGEEANRRVDVTIGVEGEEYYEIAEGLSEGQIVVGPR